MGGARNRERPSRAASSVPHSSRHQMPPQGASHLLHAAGALSRQKGRASGQSRGVCAPTCRWAAHAAERGPFTPPVAVLSLLTPPMPPPEHQPPLTTVHTAGALSRQKGRASGAESQCLRTRVPMGGARSRERPFHATSSVLTAHLTVTPSFFLCTSLDGRPKLCLRRDRSASAHHEPDVKNRCDGQQSQR